MYLIGEKFSKRTCLPGRVDDAVGGETISPLWKEKFSSVLNSVDDLEDMHEFFMKRATLPEVPVASVSVAEVQRIVKDLKNGKAVGMYLIPNEFLNMHLRIFRFLFPLLLIRF